MFNNLPANLNPLPMAVEAMRAGLSQQNSLTRQHLANIEQFIHRVGGEAGARAAGTVAEPLVGSQTRALTSIADGMLDMARLFSELHARNAAHVLDWWEQHFDDLGASPRQSGTPAVATPAKAVPVAATPVAAAGAQIVTATSPKAAPQRRATAKTAAPVAKAAAPVAKKAAAAATKRATRARPVLTVKADADESKPAPRRRAASKPASTAAKRARKGPAS